MRPMRPDGLTALAQNLEDQPQIIPRKGNEPMNDENLEPPLPPVDVRTMAAAECLFGLKWALHRQKPEQIHDEWEHASEWIRDGYRKQANQILEAADRTGDPAALTDGYHTMAELYRQRMLWHAMFINLADQTGRYRACKSHRHHDGGECFGGGRFIVQIIIDGHVIGQHYENEYWDLFQCDEKEHALEWEGTCPEEEGNIIKKHLKAQTHEQGKENE